MVSKEKIVGSVIGAALDVSIDQVAGPTGMIPTADSSSLDAYGYDPATFTLSIIFKRGGKRIYFYTGVSAEEFAEFVAADSKGFYLNNNIKPNHSVY